MRVESCRSARDIPGRCLDSIINSIKTWQVTDWKNNGNGEETVVGNRKASLDETEQFQDYTFLF